MEIELKPCPFCGCKAQRIHTFDDMWRGVRCSNFGCIANSINPEYELQNNADEDWNRRVGNGN